MRRVVAAAVVGVGVLLVEAACSSGARILDGLPCPCVSGYVCCADSGICERAGACELDKVDKTRGDDDDDDDRNDAGTPSYGTRLGTGSPQCLAMDADAVYWVNRDGSLGAVRTSAGPPLVIARFALPAAAVTACTIARSQNALWVTLFGADTLLRLSIRTGTDGGITLGDEAVRVGDVVRPTALALDATSVYVADNETNDIKRIPESADAGAMVTIGKANGGVHALVTAGDELVFTDTLGVRKMQKTGGPITTLVADEAVAGPDLGVRGGSVFYLSAYELRTVPLAGGVPADIRAGTDVFAFAVDGESMILAGTIFLQSVDAKGAPKRLFAYRESSATPTHVATDASRYVWTTEDGVFQRARPADAGPEP